MQTATKDGFCNTVLTAKTGRPELTARGVDTWKLVRQLRTDREFTTAREAARDKTLIQSIENHRWGLTPGTGTLWFEGHPGVDNLADPADLPSALERVLDEARSAGIPVGDDHGVGRLDLTADLRFDNRWEGLAFLDALAHLDLPRTKPAIYGRPPETVYLLAKRSGKKLARVYDKGRQARSALPGELIRFEDQRRFRGGARLPAEAVVQNPEVMSFFFQSRFAPVAASSEGVTIATAEVLADRISELVASGEVSPAKGCRLLGFLMHGDRVALPERTARRWRSELRELGLVLADPLDDDLVVDVAGGVEEALAGWSS